MTQSTLRKYLPLILLLTLLLVAACQPTALQTGNVASESASAPVAVAETNNAAAISGDVQTFQLTQAGTEARFTIDEVLMGQDKTVVGVTSLVEGQIMVDPTNPSSAQIGPIRIDARGLTTDSDRRNGAIQRFVLGSTQDAYRYITFTPTAVEGLPESVAIGEPFQFTVTGDLTIRDVTLSKAFPMTVTANSESELVGSGAITILLEEYQLSIPSVPSVAWVADEVKLEIEFTAAAQ
jgi:polyisoprenoid-binding protein YceI